MEIMQHETREAWLEARKAGIGGSDIAAIMGLSPWKTALDVYMERKLNVPVVETPAMRWGTKLETPIAEFYSEETGRKFIPLKFPLVKGEHKRLLASPDRLIFGEQLGLECKAVGSRMANMTDAEGQPLWGEAGTDYVPIQYLMQVQHCMACTGYKVWDLAALIGGNDFRIYHIAADDELIGEIVEAAEIFWRNHLEADVPPAPANEEQREKLLKFKFKQNVGNMLEVDCENVVVQKIIANLRDSKKVLDNAKDLLLKCENDAKELIGGFDGISFVEDGKVQKITWKKTKDSNKTDWKAVVEEVKPPIEVLKKHTQYVTGSRRFLLPKAWQTGSESED